MIPPRRQCDRRRKQQTIVLVSVFLVILIDTYRGSEAFTLGGSCGGVGVGGGGGGGCRSVAVVGGGGAVITKKSNQNGMNRHPSFFSPFQRQNNGMAGAASSLAAAATAAAEFENDAGKKDAVREKNGAKAAATSSSSSNTTSTSTSTDTDARPAADKKKQLLAQEGGTLSEKEIRKLPEICFSNDNDNNDSSSILYDVCICGAGPAGLLLASRLVAAGRRVAVIDPALHAPWPNNYGIWMDEATHFGYDDCCDAVWKRVGVVFDEKTEKLTLQRPYGRVDRAKLKDRLLRECCCRSGPGRADFAAAKAVAVDHCDGDGGGGGPSVVTVVQQAGSTATTQKSTVRALLVVDCTGFARKFVQHAAPFDPGYQVTYGARFLVDRLGPYSLDEMILMDYSEGHLSAEQKQSNFRFPSFVYVMPLSETELFMEETILVTRPAGSSADLERRLYNRMEAAGIHPVAVLEDERAAIPMGGDDPVIPQRTVGFGATASLVHPASGYMIARAMEIAPRVAAAVAPELSKLRKTMKEQNDVAGSSLSKSDLDRLSATAWKAVWPADERKQRAFMDFGFELLCLLNPQELRDFFTGFFKLPAALWEHFLSWRLSGIGHVFMGLTVWATCIPRRFMPAMLLKSIPFIPKHLLAPFLGFKQQQQQQQQQQGVSIEESESSDSSAGLYTDSIYWDARTGNSSLWEPATYYPYVTELSERSYPGERKAVAATADEEKTVVVPSTTTTTATLEEEEEEIDTDQDNPLVLAPLSERQRQQQQTEQQQVRQPSLSKQQQQQQQQQTKQYTTVREQREPEKVNA